MSLNPAGASYGWNFTKPENPGYSEQLIGTVVSMQEIQAREYKMNGGVGKPKFWDDGNPVMNIRIGFALPDGEFKTLTFAKAGKKQVAGEKPSLHVQLWDLVNRGNFENLKGHTVQITTWPANPTTGQAWGQGNPRLFDVQEIPGVTYQLAGQIPSECLVPELLADDGAAGGQAQPQAPAPAQVQTPTVPVNVPATTAVQQPVVQQTPTVPVNVPQATAQQPAATAQPVAAAQQVAQQAAPATTAAVPQGMDPAVAAAMASIGATNIQPVAEQSSIYDDDIPF